LKLAEGIAARLGGEEFCVLIEGDSSDAKEIAEELRRAVRDLQFDMNGGLGVTCSLGVAEWEWGDTIDRLLRRADVALYQAKATGRDRVVDADTFTITGQHDEWRGIARTTDRRLR
jgi:diguanylate cyclase (GGDEF)-like protein